MTSSTNKDAPISQYVNDLIRDVEKKRALSKDALVSNKETEMAIDLPQGQKLIIRGIEPGTIVEIASWSGKGRPDDSAVRMLFGASSNSGSTQMKDVSNEHYRYRPDEDDDTDTNIPRITEEFIQDQKKGKHSKKDSDSFRQPRIGVRMLKKLLILALSIGAIALLVFGLRWSALLYFEHPQSGLTTGLGSANTAIVAVSPNADIEPSSTIIAEIDGKKILVAVTQVSADKYLVYTGQSPAVVDANDVVGRALFVIPFIGNLMGIFN
ncbi:MAG: hypothetical protein RL677_884 [Actinomycetota bacterium]|jgi:hypothetical protein